MAHEQIYSVDSIGEVETPRPLSRFLSSLCWVTVVASLATMFVELTR
jgi:hypothetical protein